MSSRSPRRRGTTTAVLVLMVTVALAALSGCTTPGTNQVRVVDGPDGRVTAEVFVDLLHRLDEEYVLGPGTATAEEVADRLTAEVPSSTQVRSFLVAQALELGRDRSGWTPARSSESRVTAVSTGYDEHETLLALITVETRRVEADGTSTSTTADYAVSWDCAGGVPAEGSPEPDAVELVGVHGVYDDDGEPALSGDASTYPVGAVLGYAKALHDDDDAEIDDLEGVVQSSDGLRAALRERLENNPRITVVELPGERHGDVRVVYAVQEASKAALRFEVDMSSGDPEVTAFL